MKIGFGRREMTFPAGFFPAEGFVTQVHPLYVRVMLLAEESPFALVSVEMTSLSDGECEALRKAAAERMGIGEDRVWIAATHTFSAPHILPDFALRTEEERAGRETLRRILREAVTGAAEAAREDAAECALRVYQGMSGVMASRDIELPEGWWIGCGGDGPSDRTLTVLAAEREGRIRGLALHANVQPSVLDGTGAAEGKCVSGDLAGIACAELEKHFPGAAALFVIGAAGDQAPARKAKGYMKDAEGRFAEKDLRERGVPVAEELGRILAEEAEAALRGAGRELRGPAELRRKEIRLPAKKMNRNLRELKPARSCEWEPDGEKETTLELLILGEMAVLGVKPELTFPTLKRIQAASPYPLTLAATMINGGAKYMADRSAYDRCMYEAVNSPFAPGAAERMAEAAAKLLRG